MSLVVILQDNLCQNITRPGLCADDGRRLGRLFIVVLEVIGKNPLEKNLCCRTDDVKDKL